MKDMNNKESNRIQIIIAIIGLLGTIGAGIVNSNITIKIDKTATEVLTKTIKNNKYILQAKINDPDGYTNVRSKPSIDGYIIDVIDDGKIFYTYLQNGSWWQIKTSDNKTGYIHRTRIKLLK